VPVPGAGGVLHNRVRHEPLLILPAAVRQDEAMSDVTLTCGNASHATRLIKTPRVSISRKCA
jgi:hypothetical protein